MGAGGLDIAVAMAGGPSSSPSRGPRHPPHRSSSPGSREGRHPRGARRLTVKGGVNRVLEYTGPGSRRSPCPTGSPSNNMGAELAPRPPSSPATSRPASTSPPRVAASPGRPRARRRGGRHYDETLEINLDTLEPLIARPHAPDAVVKVREGGGHRGPAGLHGSCTQLLLPRPRHRRPHAQGPRRLPGLSMTVTPGSKQVFSPSPRPGPSWTHRGRRPHPRVGCGPCIGMGQARPAAASPSAPSTATSRAAPGPWTTKVYLASPETCVARR